VSTIAKITPRDARFALQPGEGVDAVHSDPVYSYAIALIHTDGKLTGTGLAFTLGGGNQLVCQAIELLAESLVGRDIDELMSNWAAASRRLADHPQLRWLGPHKGVVHLALSSITNACFDLWAKTQGVPLWKLLIDLSPEDLVNTLDLSYMEDELTRDEALNLIAAESEGCAERSEVLSTGYPGYDTSVGWFDYADQMIVDNAKRAVAGGFNAMKLKVGSADRARDVRRAELVREAVGDTAQLMFDANQAWAYPTALEMCGRLAGLGAYWIEEPTHPDDVFAHKALAEAIAPSAIALGEHVPNRVLFKNFMRAGAMQFVQVDAVRVAGVSEFITVSLLARKYGLKVVPHVGDMGQLHQHLVLFNHIALGLDKVFLEYIPHLRDHFVHPACVEGGTYRTPQEPGAGCDLM
jgi:L-fuconate dehydratase